MPSSKPKFVLVLAVLGLLVSFYLTYVKLTGSKIVCGFGSCETVQNSVYSEIYGVPVSIFGVLFYLSIFVLAFYRKTIFLRLLSIFGVVFSAYLTYIELFVIEAVCFWCVISAILSVLILLAVLKTKT